MSRILVVDDDATIRESIRIALTSGGFDVVAVEGGEHALELFPRMACDGAIVDLLMPGMDGLETIRALRALSPGLPIVIMSGALAHADVAAPDFLRMACRLHGVARLAKPFTLAELLRTVRDSVAVAA